MPEMDSRIFKKRIQRRFYHACNSDCDSDSEIDGLSASSLPLTETCMEYFQDSFPGSEGLGRLDMPMAATVTKRNQVSPCSMVMSMMYAKRLRQRNKQYLQSMSSTDVFFISMMMASKYLYDEGVEEEVYNDEWAASVGHETDDVNQMEMDFLKEMDWQLFAKHEDFDKALTAVERRLALKEGVKRGWFTYTEMAVLLDWDPVFNLWNQVGMDCTKMVSLMSAVYVASLVSMMGSAAVALQLSGPVASATVAAILSLRASTMSTTSHSMSLPSVAVLCNQSSLDTMVVGADEVQDAMTPEMLVSLPSMHVGIEEDFVTSYSLEQNHSHFKSEDMNVGRISHDGQIGEENYDKEDGLEGGNGNTVSKQKLKGATSVFSMWLFDSLISQVWSVFGGSRSAGREGSLQRDENRNSDSGLSFEGNAVSGKLCDNCRCVERRKSKGVRSAKPSPISQSAATHISMKDDVVNVSRMDKTILDCCVDCASGCDTAPSTTGCSPKGCKCPTNHPSTLNSDPCKCSLSDCRDLRTNPIVHESPEARPGYSDSYTPSRHVFPASHENNNKDNLDFILPLSLTEVPILDPVGFFTKNFSPTSYVLST